MNTYNINDNSFINSLVYQNFLSQNPSQGFLKIRAYAASQAIPIKNLRVQVSKIVDGNKIIFFEGNTNESGVIENIKLPAPKIEESNLLVPNSIVYDVIATYQGNENIYKVNIYENIYVIQTINIVPVLNTLAGGN